MDTMTPIEVLIRLRSGYGLGDACQLTAVMRHVVAARPHWLIDYVADPGREVAMLGHVRSVYTHANQPDEAAYDRVIDIDLYDTFAAWEDRPNTRVTSCLHEKFGLPWQRELAKYQIHVTDEAKEIAKKLVHVPKRTVAIHWQGDSAKTHKDLDAEHAFRICLHMEYAGLYPLVMDWRNISSLRVNGFSLGNVAMPYRDEWGRSAQVNAAIIARCSAFIGIDSGPGKCATATETPTLIIWTRHHPALFHDPAGNTTHLVPVGHGQMHPVNGNEAVLRFFASNYNVMEYADGDPVPQVREWLASIF